MASKRAAIYCRISDDRVGDEAGVTRQREDCMALAQQRGWDVVTDIDPAGKRRDVFEDNDISAFSGKVRPAYRRLFKAVETGQVDVVVAWHPDRLHRSPRELEDWIDLQEATKTKVSTVRAGEWDLSTPAGRMTARQIGAVARYESETKSDRVRRAMLQRAEQGRGHGALRTYGLRGTRNADRTHSWEIVEDEAAVIREAAGRVMAGEALLSIVNDLNDREVPTLRGKRWQRSTLRSMLVSARVAGWREHTPERGTGGKVAWTGGPFVAKAEWPAILTRRQVEALRRRLGDPSKQRAASTRSYLLSNGLTVCDNCRQPLRGRAPNGKREYTCASVRSNGNGCGKVTIKADPLEDYVLDSVEENVANGDLASRLAGDDAELDEALALAASLEAAMVALGADFGCGAITRAEWQAARGPLTVRLEAARREVTRHESSGALAILSGGLERWRAGWEASGLDGKRARLRMVMSPVRVAPVRVRGRNTFDPDRVDWDWAG